jgi:hypothetical protein
MHFFRRPGVIHLDCFTDNIGAITYTKIEHSMKFIPDWWKQLDKIDPTNMHPTGTMKSCQGFLDLFRKGIVLPLWSDLSVLLGESGTDEVFWQFADYTGSAGIHNAGQRGTYLPEEKYQHLKLTSPWLFTCKEDLHWVLHPISWCFDNPKAVIIPEGVVNFKWQYGTNVNMFFERKPEKQRFLFEAGQPMLQFIPMSEKEIVIHNHFIEPEEMKKKIGATKIHKFRNHYNIGKKIRQANDSKCPFGFK